MPFVMSDAKINLVQGAVGRQFDPAGEIVDSGQGRLKLGLGDEMGGQHGGRYEGANLIGGPLDGLREAEFAVAGIGDHLHAEARGQERAQWLERQAGAVQSRQEEELMAREAAHGLRWPYSRHPR